MKITVNLKPNWIYADGGLNALYMQKFLARCRQEFSQKILIVSVDLCACTLELSEEADVSATIEALLKAGFPSEDIYNEVCSLSIDGREVHAPAQATSSADTYTPTGAANATADSEAARPSSTDETPRPAPAVMDRINALVGCEDFKDFCAEIHARAERIRAHKTQDVFFGMGYLFQINDGYDLDAILDLLKELLIEERIFSGRDVGTMHETLPPFGKNDSETEKMQHFINALTISNGGRCMCVFDIDNWIGHTETALFKRFLKQIVRLHWKHALLIFRCHQQPEHLTHKTINDFNDLLLARSIVIREYTNEEMLNFAEQKLSRYGYTLSSEAKALFDKKLKQERMDGYFYGLDTVYKIVDEMIISHETYDTLGGDSITESDMQHLMDRKEDPMSAKALLSRVYGMDSVRRQIYGICNQILFARNNGIKLPNLHMKFVGNPGTGKTTMARIVAKILSEAGALRIGNLYEHKGRDLCGEYIGQTAKITTGICEEAYGSVLFIDEAYSLYQGGEKDFGKEAIETLITEMENHSDDLLVIFAGYTDEMETFEKSNPGLKSRIPFTITFPNYTVDELYHIFELMVTKEFECSQELLDAAKNYFYSLPDSVRNNKQFGNARFVRNLYERTWGAAVNRTQTTGERTTLELVDIEEAIAAIEKEMPTAPKRNKIGFN